MRRLLSSTSRSRSCIKALFLGLVLCSISTVLLRAGPILLPSPPPASSPKTEPALSSPKTEPASSPNSSAAENQNFQLYNDTRYHFQFAYTGNAHPNDL